MRTRFIVSAVHTLGVLSARASADAFILKDGSCVEGTVWSRTSSNIFVRLADGRNRNIPTDSLAQTIEGENAHCPGQNNSVSSHTAINTEEAAVKCAMAFRDGLWSRLQAQPTNADITFGDSGSLSQRAGVTADRGRWCSSSTSCSTR